MTTDAGGRFTYTLAGPADDADLRRLMAQTPMPGDVTVTFEREPSYFAAARLHGPRTQVILARAADTGAPAGVMVRAAAPCFVNGRPLTLGYLGDLRVAPAYRGQCLIEGGAPFMTALHAADPYPAYLAVVATANRRARDRMVTRRPPGLPPSRRLTPIETVAIIVRRRHAAARPAGVVAAEAGDLAAVTAALRRLGARRQLFPVVAAADFDHPDAPVPLTATAAEPAVAQTIPAAADFAAAAPQPAAGRLPGLRITDFRLVRRDDRIAAVGAVWDMRAYRQSIVHGYHGALRAARPLYNAAAPLLGIQPLPPPGAPLAAAFGAFIAVEEDDPTLFAPLLAALVQQAAARGLATLMVGFPAADPLLPVARRYPHVTYHSDLFLTAWDDIDAFVASLDGRAPYLEIATL